MKKSYVLPCLFVLLAGAVFAQAKKVSKDDAIAEKNAKVVEITVQQAMSSVDYMVTAGDVYSLTYAANGTPVSYIIPVDSTYKIRVANLAVLDVGGRSYLSLKKQVEEIVQKNYPLSGVQFVLTSPSSFNVTVEGEVYATTEKTVGALTRLSSVVEGTMTEYSSTRKVTVTSTSGNVTNYDLFKATRFGDLSQDPYVRPGDVITINRIERVVTITGAVERPGRYELLEGENLKELITYYGNGLTAMADISRVEITRVLDNQKKSGNKIYLNLRSAYEEHELICYDAVDISNYHSLRPVMFIEGAIMVSTESEDGTTLNTSDRIPVQFNTDTEYSYFIQTNSGWFSSSASDIENAYIIRGAEIIPINIYKILYDLEYHNKEIIMPGDVLRIPFKQLFVTVAGAVYTPGRYPYIPDRTADYYIALAGGFVKEKNSHDAMEIYDMNGNKLLRDDIITPESIITAKTNSGLYHFNQYSGVITTVLTLVTTSLSAYTVIRAMGN